MAASSNDRIKVTFLVDKAEEPENWTGEEGLLTEDLFLRKMPKPAKDTLILTCGSKPFNQLARKIAEKNGYSEDMIFKF